MSPLTRVPARISGWVDRSPSTLTCRSRRPGRWCRRRRTARKARPRPGRRASGMAVRSRMPNPPSAGAATAAAIGVRSVFRRGLPSPCPAFGAGVVRHRRRCTRRGCRPGSRAATSRPASGRLWVCALWWPGWGSKRLFANWSVEAACAARLRSAPSTPPTPSATAPRGDRRRQLGHDPARARPPRAQRLHAASRRSR